MEENGRVKTDKYIYFTFTDGECSKILVSNPVTLVQKFMGACEKKLDRNKK